VAIPDRSAAFALPPTTVTTVLNTRSMAMTTLPTDSLACRFLPTPSDPANTR
jgi:hypothetical protein